MKIKSAYQVARKNPSPHDNPNVVDAASQIQDANIPVTTSYQIKPNKGITTMQMLGMIGGTSWHSTIEYYRNINQAANDHFGNNTNPPLLLYNLNQALVHACQTENNWDGIAGLISRAASCLQNAGAKGLIFCANTPHKVFDTVESQMNIPILHIADATAHVIQARELTTVGFIGTRFTMEEGFVTDRIASHGIDVLVPTERDEIQELHRIIQMELTFGRVDEASKKYVLNSIQGLVTRGAEGIVLGCTEFPLMICDSDLRIPIFNTTEIHSAAAFQFIFLNRSHTGALNYITDSLNTE